MLQQDVTDMEVGYAEEEKYEYVRARKGYVLVHIFVAYCNDNKCRNMVNLISTANIMMF